MKKSLFIAIITMFLFSSPNAWATEGKPLTVAQVKKIIIGKKWHTLKGEFLFKKNGTYTYKRPYKKWGPYRYKFRSNGVIQGETTTYQFFRKSNGNYEYYDGRIGQYIRVFLN